VGKRLPCGLSSPTSRGRGAGAAEELLLVERGARRQARPNIRWIEPTELARVAPPGHAVVRVLVSARRRVVAVGQNLVQSRSFEWPHSRRRGSTSPGVEPPARAIAAWSDPYCFLQFPPTKSRAAALRVPERPRERARRVRRKQSRISTARRGPPVDLIHEPELLAE